MAVVVACEKNEIVTPEGAVRLSLASAELEARLEASLEGKHLAEYRKKKDIVLETILRSRYANLYKLLRHHLSEETYLGLVRNQILVDVQVRSFEELRLAMQARMLY